MHIAYNSTTEELETLAKNPDELSRENLVFLINHLTQRLAYIEDEDLATQDRVEELETEVEMLDDKVSQLQHERDTLEDEIAELRAEIAQ